MKYVEMSSDSLKPKSFNSENAVCVQLVERLSPN